MRFEYVMNPVGALTKPDHQPLHQTSIQWSPCPSHHHDEADFRRVTYLEETYYYRLNPADGLGIQRVYTDDLISRSKSERCIGVQTVRHEPCPVVMQLSQAR